MDDLIPGYLDALERHIEESAFLMEGRYIDTVYFGGGTPSYIGGKRIASIFDTIKSACDVLKDSEVTIECNPDSVTLRDLQLLRKSGFNRVSFGMQSANAELLKIIGRRHSFTQVQSAVAQARKAGFDNINLDLIYGLPSQTRKDWADSLGRALELRPEHISCYGLKLEEGTKLFDSYNNSPLLPGDDEQADMYLYAVETLHQYGYPQYEISNFSLPGYECKHNLKYWRLEDYMGFGPSAHSFAQGRRYSFVSSLTKYISGVMDGGEIIDSIEDIPPPAQAAEYIMLGMRTNMGISESEYAEKYRGSFDALESLFKDYEQKGWAEKSGDSWHFTSSGYLLSNTLIGLLLETEAQAKLWTSPWMKDYISDEPDLSLPSDENKIYVSDFS